MRSPRTTFFSMFGTLLILSLACDTQRLAPVDEVPVASITVTPAELTIGVGGRVAVLAIPVGSSGTPLADRSVAWSSSNPAIVTVSPIGNASAEVLGVAVGTASITASSGGASSSVAVNVTPTVAYPGKVTNLSVASVTSNSVTLSFTEVTNGAGSPASYDVRYAIAPLSWGSATSVAQGTCTVPLAGIAIGTTRTCTVQGLSASTNYQFQLVAFRGTLNVDAVFGNLSNVTSGTTAAASLPVATVGVTPATASVGVSETVQLTATVSDANGNTLTGRAVTWSSSDAGVATVSAAGLVSGISAGTATITAMSEGKTGTANMTVTSAPPPPPPAVASVSVTPATASVTLGQTTQLTATPRDASGNALTGRVVTWASSNSAVASVNASGLVTGVAAGSATITATSEGKSGTSAITVTAPLTNPGTVTNLSVASVTPNSVTLSFTEVHNGAGAPATYDVRYAVSPLSWGSATPVAQGTCAVPLAGTTIGATRTCTVQGLSASTSYQFQLVAFRGTLNVDAVFGNLSNVASGTTAASTAPVATVTVTPATASVAAGGTQPFSATLKDASGNTLTGRAITWSSANTAVATVASNGAATAVAEGTATITATSEGKSGTATLTVTATASGGIVFQSDWSAATGTSNAAVTDGGRWMNYWEFDQGTGVQLMSVVSGGPGGRNALKVLQRAELAAALQQDTVLPPSTDFYVRFYMRNDDVSPNGDHIVTVDAWQYGNLTFMRKFSSTTGWRFAVSLYGCGYTYPIGHWSPNRVLQLGAWYRFEYFVDYVDANHIQLHARVYDANGTLILTDADFRQEDWGSSSWNGRNDWTLASYRAAGHTFCVNPAPMRTFSLGNNGQAGALDTGLAWYFAGVQLRTDRWPGP